jgi:ubiquinone/menaquinone biosynthesis C-methylase UbiE
MNLSEGDPMRLFIFTLCLGVAMSIPALASDTDALITHRATSGGDNFLVEARQRLEQCETLTLSKEEALAMFDDLTKFELGRFLLENKGLNGFWTSYLILQGLKSEPAVALEKWVLNTAPAVLATRERFHIFQAEILKLLKPGMKVASIPCGVMDDLLTLDNKATADVELVGVDLDPVSLDFAESNARACGKQDNCRFFKQSAWELKQDGEFDIITSNGLNIYEADDSKVTDLYRNFNRALKAGGTLITSFLTPPPMLSPESTWKGLNPEDLRKQKALFADVIGVSWQSYRTEAKTRQQLESAGFEVLRFIYDRCGLFPTVVARKP